MPEGQQLLQIAATDVYPAQPVPLGGWLMQVQAFDLLQQHGFFQSHGYCQLRREHQ